MTLIIQKPTGASLNLRKTWQPMDADAAAYITAVETADGQALEEKTKIAIDNFVLGCKSDGIWTAIKASCILAGARTLTGALVPLVNPEPTNFNFAAGDYNRKTGLVGNGSTKYLDSNRNNNADPQDNNHLAVYASSVGSPGSMFICSNNQPSSVGHTNILHGGNGIFFHRSRSSIGTSSGASIVAGLSGISRNASTEYTARTASTNFTISVVSDGLASSSLEVYRRNSLTPEYSTARLAFYSIGESLDLALLDARVTDLINAFGAAIP
jgi:hypothetical protein